MLALIPRAATAQETATSLAGVYERVTDISTIASTDCCLIGAWAEFGSDIRTFNLATTSFLSSNKKKLKALPLSDGAEKRIVCQDASAVWHIEKQSDNYLLKAAEDGRVLSRYSNDKLGLLLENYKSKSLSEWTITADASGTFAIGSAEGGKRKFACDYSNDTTVCYDFYVDGRPLYIYKRISSSVPDQQTIDVPKDGSRVVLSAEGVAFCADATAAVSTDGLLLLNGSYAPNGTYTSFVCQTSSEDAKAFALKNTTDGTYLGADVSLTSEPFLWQLRDGKLTDYSSVDETRYVCYNAATRQWSLLTQDEQKQQGALSATIGLVAESPTSALAADGVLSLAGGWSADELSQVNFANVTCLDMTGISLPVKALPFKNSPQTKNFPIFVSQESMSAVPDDWKFVVNEDGNEYRLGNVTALVDGEPLYSPYDITLSAAQLTYSRTPLQGTAWQTLCLPFAVDDLPDNAAFYSAAELGDDALSLRSASTLKAGVPYLFRSTNEESGFAAGETLEFKCSKGALLGVSFASNALQGTFSHFAVSADDTGVFMLNPATSAFQKAASGSRLKPFRAYLHSANNSVKFRLTYK